MKNIQRILQKYKTVLQVKEKLEDELLPFLNKYYYGYICWDSISIKDNKFSWKVEVPYGDCTEKEFYQVTLDYFNDPEGYKRKEREIEEKASQERIKKQQLAIEKREKQQLKKLKKKYE